MGKSSAPKPPDPKKTSAAQTGTNVGTAIANQMMGMVGQNTPYGSLSYDQTGTYTHQDPYTGKSYDIPTFTANTRLTHDGKVLQQRGVATQKNLASLAQTQSGRLNSLLGQRFDLRDMPEGGSFDRDFSRDRQRVENALMDRMSPGMEQDREALETRLANQGIGLGSEAYDRAMRNADQQRNDARMSAILNAGQEQSRLAGLDLAGAQYADGQRQSAMEQAFAERNQPLNEIAALMSGSQVQNPQFTNVPTATIPTTDNAAIIGTNYNQRLNKWQEDQAQTGSFLTGLGGLFSAGLSGGLVDVASPLMTIGRR